MKTGRTEIVHELTGLQFLQYEKEEIRKICRTQISVSCPFDEFLNATKSGLYDKSLGVQNGKENCELCSMPHNVLFARQSDICPGHFGYISLPLLVFNPVTFRTMFQWLSMTCLQCHTFYKAKGDSILILKQMEALDHGLVSVVTQLGSLYSELVEEGKDMKDKATLSELESRLEDCLNSALDSGCQLFKMNNTKQITGCRQELCKEYLGKKIKKCRECGKEKIPFRHESMARIFYGRPIKSRKDYTKPSKQAEKTEITEERTGEMTLYPTAALEHMRKLWSNEHEILSHLFGAFSIEMTSEWPTDTFFIKTLMVSPSRIRPPNFKKNEVRGDKQTEDLCEIVSSCSSILEAHGRRQGNTEVDMAVAAVMGTNLNNNSEYNQLADIFHLWHTLQIRVNAYYDKNLGKVLKKTNDGIKQLFEKKEGLLRMHMMGKRVNCALRSVISPDPCLDTNEVGVAERLAKLLQFPESVNEKNVAQLRQMVINGPEKYPGAVSIQNSDGSRTLLKNMPAANRCALAKQLLTPSAQNDFSVMSTKVVNRHAINGDVLMLNRQPTLHKNSIQAFKVRVLPSDNTIRINYSACKAFNADFDGDEMNAHFLQDYASQTEGLEFVLTDHQYLVPKDGSPISGLIQDHMIGGVLLTMRGQVFNKQNYTSLVYAALKDFKGPVKLLPPCIIKPIPTWSGKQVVSTILINIVPKGKKLMRVTGRAKINDQEWVNVKKDKSKSASGDKYEFMSESDVIISDSELLVGVLDKNAFGATPYGLVHCYHELYGAEVSGALLTYLARLFLVFLKRISSFTMGAFDVMINKMGNKKRRKQRALCRKSGNEIFQNALGLKDVDPKVASDAVRRAHLSSDPKDLASLDGAIKNQLSRFQDAIKDSCWPANLLKCFPRNGLQLMVVSGAKGSLVNCMQMSCLLGQVDLESGRPPMNLAGSTLPRYKPYALSVHSGGFIDRRFFSAINLQEFFFHSMAGREGLVDTAVKTSRSGYLQRCLVKHLESIKVEADETVRDADGSIIQFLYGEDGMDVCKTSFLKEKLFPFLIENYSVLKVQDMGITDMSDIIKHNKQLKKWTKKFQQCGSSHRVSPFLEFCKRNWSAILDDVSVDSSAMVASQDEDGSKPKTQDEQCKEKLIGQWKALPQKAKDSCVKQTIHRPEPVTDKFFPTSHFGSISEKLQMIMDNYISANKHGLLYSAESMKKPTCKSISEWDFRNLIYQKYQSSLAPPGDSVGILAATSIGEQTTQMTLNTFHFAGHGSMNVTLGIPRLREILMTASAKIKTPVMMVPLMGLNDHQEHRVERLIRKFCGVSLSEVIDSIDVEATIASNGHGAIRYNVILRLMNKEFCKREYGLKHEAIFLQIEEKLSRNLDQAIKKYVKSLNCVEVLSIKEKERRVRKGGEEDAEEEDEEPNDEQRKNDDHSDNSSDSESETEEDDGCKRNEDNKNEENEESDGDSENEKSKDGQETDEEDAETNDHNKSDIDEDMDMDASYNNDKKRKHVEEKEEEEVTADDSRKKKIKIDSPPVPGVEVGDFAGQYKFTRGCIYAVDYRRGADKMSCEFALEIDSKGVVIDFGSVAAQVLSHTTVIMAETRYIKNCIKKEIEESDSPPWMLQGSNKQGSNQKIQFEGVDFHAIFKYQKLLEINNIYSNDIHAIARTYGIEAARIALINEIRNVFRVYGIEVDYRHLTLIADYMTFSGVFEPMSRKGLSSNPSVLQKASFETAFNFLKDSLVEGGYDNLENPSSRLIVGKPVSTGTATFDICMPMEFD